MSKKVNPGNPGGDPKRQEVPEVELVPDAWPMFRRFILHVVKAGPQHRKPKSTRNRGKRASAEKREPSA